MNKEKLIEILEDNDIRISKKGNICLNDFVENIVESKNPKLYIKKLTNYDKIAINDEYYIKPEDCVDILKNTNFKKCKDIYTKIQIDDEDETSLIDVEQQIFQFEGHKFLAFFVEKDEGDWDVYLKGSEIAKYLNYVDDKQAIRDHVDDDNKLTFFQFNELFPMVKKTIPKNMDKKTIIINLSGFFNLVHESKKPFAKKIKRWLDNEVMPALIKYGTYTMQPKKLIITKFYDVAIFSDYDNKAVVYIAYVGKYKGEYIFKYGLSRDMFRREYKEHRKIFDLFQVVFIGETDNCEEIETLFEKELKIRYLHRELTIGGKSQTELFTITTKYAYTFFVSMMQNLIANHKLPAIKEADTKNMVLTNAVDIYRQSEELRKLELQYRLSENFKLELERDIRIKELDSETAVAVKNIEVELQREKNKQIAMENGYDLDLFINKNINAVKKGGKDKHNIVVL
jgi:prophage antirepressor-like protein